MASRLCTRCKVIHTKPWDKHCKAVINDTDNATVADNEIDENDNLPRQAEGARPKGKSEGEKYLELHGELLSSLKSLSSQMCTYGKKVDDLASRVYGQDS